MATKRVPVTYAFGLRDRIDPKLAPFGVLKVGKNLRVRKDGRLGTRNGYQALSMTTANGTLAAYDLHEYRGRLIALGSDNGEGFPSDIFEYTGLANQGWRATDAIGRRVALNPFTNPREVGGILQVEDGVGLFDAVAGGGYVCMVYRATTSTGPLYALIVDATTDQTILQEKLSDSNGALGGFSVERFAVCAIGSTFYVAAVKSDLSIVIARYRVGTDARFLLHGANVKNADGVTVATLDLVPVNNPTTAAIAVAWGSTSPGAVKILVRNAAGTQLGSTISVSITGVAQTVIEADQTDNTINLYTVEGASTGNLRTYNFAGTLLHGPTATTVGATGSIARLPAQGTLAESVAVAVNKSDHSVTIQVFDQDAHTQTATQTLQQLHLRSRLLSAQSPGTNMAVAFAGLVAPNLPSGNDMATNGLFYITLTIGGTTGIAHLVTRDFVRAKDVNLISSVYHKFPNLSLDSTTGALCWAANRDPGVESNGMPVLTLLDMKSTARRHAVEYGGLLYFAGATPSVYDGRFAGELGFSESPGIQSLTASAASGALASGATYYYAAHWEIVLADGSVMVSPVSVGGNSGESVTSAAVVTLGASDNQVTAVVTTPHSVRVAASNALAGASVVCVLSRTEWIVTETPATLLGTRDFTTTPLTAGDLTGKTLNMFISSVILQTVTFSATDDSATEVAAAINAQTTGLTASVVGGAIFLETDNGGSSEYIIVTGGTATVAGSAFVGFATGDVAHGASTGEPGSILRRCVVSTAVEGMSNYGRTRSIVDTVSDDALATQEPIYTQGERGVLSGPLEQNAPRGCSYITATESRLLTGGLARSFEVQISRAAFLGEPFSFSEFSQFFAKASGPVAGVESLDAAKLIFTSDRILALGGEGPDDVGGGALDPPIEIPTPAGLSNSWSLLKAPDGLWFQLDDTKLFRIPRGGGSPTWEGVDVESVLTAYPNIAGACKHKGDNAAVFACNADTADAAQIVVRDFRTENWFTDDPFSSVPAVPIDAISAFGDRIAYVADGVVYAQTTGFTDGVSDFIRTEAISHPLYPFGVGGYGQVYDLLVTGEYRGDCALGCRVSYDDGQSYTALPSFELLAADGLVVGQTIQRRWTLPQDITSSVVVELSADNGGSGPSEGFVYNQIDVLVEAEDGLRELHPDEMA